MKEYRAFWASTWYTCDNLHALVRVLREVGASSFPLAVGEVPSSLNDNPLHLFVLSLEGEEFEL